MRRIYLIAVAALLCCGIKLYSANAADKGDMVFGDSGQAVQAFAPNFFQLLTVNSTSFDLVATPATLYFELYSPIQCKAYITATNSKVGAVAFTIPALERVGFGKPYGKSFAIYSGCTGADYKAQRGNWQSYP